MASLKRQLDEDDRRELRDGRTPPHTISANTFIDSAIQIEREQYVLYTTLIKTTNVYSQTRHTLKGTGSDQSQSGYNGDG
jgi:hypothetical protein